MNVLLVSESFRRRAFYKRLLLQFGVEEYGILQADGVADALAAENREGVDFILCALNEGSASLRLVRAIRALDATVPIVMVGEISDRPAIVEAIRSGCSDYLMSPVSSDTLEEKLCKWGGLHSESAALDEASAVSRFCAAAVH